MKLSLRLVFALVASISMVTFVIARNEVSTEKAALRNDLERRGELLTESLQETVEPVVARNGADIQLRRIVDRFGNRERLAGIAVYDNDGKVLAESANIASRAEVPPHAVTETITNDQGTGEFATLSGFAYVRLCAPVTPRIHAFWCTRNLP